MSAPWLWIVKDRRFAMGATLPYVLGAMRLHRGVDEIAPDEASKAELRDLLVAMRDEVPPPECIVVQPCSTIEALVAAARPRQPEGRAFISSPSTANRGLYYRVDGHGIRDFDTFVEAMWNIHKEYISQGRFNRAIGGLSGRDWDYVRFDDEERKEIRMTLADPSSRSR